ncbi:hypothetical protein NERG_02175 [Nematocida ausubeli]|uniref:Kinesin-like protein n=1 Tax=Nematocida ausubeli (strain ATCC PRA-371 / ERTm2) TaxID=1913371 RepID=H8ZF06_NEMA1|nr:hypothetical protein NERG_02175 [Nematocida ausubeli]
MAFNTDRLSNILSNMEENTSNLKYAIRNNVSEILKKDTNQEIEMLRTEVRVLKERALAWEKERENLRCNLRRNENINENALGAKSTAENILASNNAAQHEIEELKQQLEKAKKEHGWYKEWAEAKIKAQLVDILELKGAIRVVTRIKPFSSKEQVLFTEDTIEVPQRSFASQCTRVLPPKTTQKEVFSEIEDLVHSVTKGFKVSILAYGPTGSGKTYTMEGASDAECVTAESSRRSRSSCVAYAGFTAQCTCEPCAGKGVVYRSTDVLRKELERMELLGYTHIVKVSGVELYNDKVIKSVEQQGIDKIEEVFKKVSSDRRISSTACNQRSSRSHLILRISVHLQREVNSRVEYIDGSLCIVDLAGSERLNHSKAEGERMKEAVEINKSLTALGDVVHAISNNTAHIPYRNSTLTSLLKSTLGAGAKTAFIINVDPGSSIDETITALRFCNRLQMCKLGRSKASALEIVK